MAFFGHPKNYAPRPAPLLLNSLQIVVFKLQTKINLFIVMTSSYIHPITTVIKKAVAANTE